MSINLKSMSRKELLQLQKDVEAALKNADARERREALKAAEKAAAEFGFSLTELNGAAPKSGRSKSMPKYANPEDPSQTWTGRGRKPQWIHEAIDAGKDLTTLEI